MGGEKYLVSVYGVQALGSPPHGRGKVTQSIEAVRDVGITPAWAGKRSAII